MAVALSGGVDVKIIWQLVTSIVQKSPLDHLLHICSHIQWFIVYQRRHVWTMNTSQGNLAKQKDLAMELCQLQADGNETNQGI